MPDERPIPKCGSEFVSIYGSGWQTFREAGNGSLHEEFQFTLALTQRITQVPFDRQGETLYAHEFLADSERFGVSATYRASQFRAAIHNNYSILKEMNRLLTNYEDTDYPFLTVPQWISTTPSPILVGPSHFSSEDDGPEESGFLMKITFGKVQRSLRLVTGN
jgi:hypothetical protein